MLIQKPEFIQKLQAIVSNPNDPTIAQQYASDPDIQSILGPATKELKSQRIICMNLELYHDSNRLQQLISCGYVHIHCKVNIPNEIIKLICSWFILDRYNINLQYHSHRGHYSFLHLSYHPKNTLTFSCNKYDLSSLISEPSYASPLVANFSSSENDWIVYTIEHNAKYIDINGFGLINCKNISSKQGIKKMKISIGDTDKNKWYPFKPDIIDCENKYEIQYFALYGVDYTIIKKQKLKHIKLELIENYGQNS